MEMSFFLSSANIINEKKMYDNQVNVGVSQIIKKKELETTTSSNTPQVQVNPTPSDGYPTPLLHFIKKKGIPKECLIPSWF